MSAAAQITQLIKFDIEVIKGPHAGKKYSFDKKSIFIGRGSENEICLSEDPRISRQHAEIKQIDGQFYIVNLSQRNFILVDGEKVETEKLQQNILLQIGESELKFSSDLQKMPAEEATIAVPAEQRLSTYQPAQAPVMRNQAGSALAKPSQQKLFVQPQHTSQHKTGQTRPARPVQAQDNSRFKFYMIITGVAVFLYFILFSGNKAKKQEVTFRGSSEVQQDIEASVKTEAQMKERISKSNDVTYKRAQENYVKGFREYRQANYSRAKDYFQIVLSLDSENELAKRYYRLSMVKFDELVQANFNQGLKYREKRNYRLCKSSFANVLVMIQNNKSHPIFPQADQFFNECTNAQLGRY